MPRNTRKVHAELPVQKYDMMAFMFCHDFRAEGGQAIVYKASHFLLKDVALKKFHTKFEAEQEIAFLVTVNHKNITKILGLLVENQECIGYVMEFMEMGTLDDVIHDENVKYERKQIISWVQQIGQGLQYLHGQDIIHRDIKPKNILLGKSKDHIKVSDFGSIRPWDTTDFTTEIGTIKYRAPEVVDAKNYGKSADIYSLVITIWEILHRNGWNKQTYRRPTIFFILEHFNDSKDNESKFTTLKRALKVFWRLVKKPKIFIIGGVRDGEVVDIVNEYDNDHYTICPHGHLFIPRSTPYKLKKHGTACIHRNLYVFGGKLKKFGLFQGTILNRLQMYTSWGTWINKSSMIEKRYGISNSSLVVNDCIWVMGGRNDERVLNSVEMYNPMENLWTFMQPMKEHRYGAAAAAIGGKIFVCGGRNDSFVSSSVEVYDIEEKRWIFFESMPSPRFHAAIVADGENLIIFGGKDGTSSTSTVWQKDIKRESEKWIELPSMLEPRYGFAVWKDPDTMSAIGGNENKTVEIFDGIQWTEAEDLMLKSPLLDILKKQTRHFTLILLQRKWFYQLTVSIMCYAFFGFILFILQAGLNAKNNIPK